MRSIDWPLYDLLLSGSDMGMMSSRDVTTRDALENFAEAMLEDPGYQPEALVNGVITPIITNRSSTIKCSIKGLPNTHLHIGDMVECLGETWLLVELYTDKIGVYNGVMWLCNKTICFQNFSETIYTKWCVIDDGSYTKNSSDPDIRTLSSTYKMYISIDEDTKKLFVDKRLGLGSIYDQRGQLVLEVCKITGVDVTSHNFGEGSHLMVDSLQRDVYNPGTDDMSLNLCDVYHGEDSEDEPAENGHCTIKGKDSIRMGVNKKYTAIFYDSDDVEVTGVDPIWTIDIPVASNISSTITDGVVTLSVPFDEKEIGNVVTLSIKDENGIYGQYEKKVQVTTIG